MYKTYLIHSLLVACLCIAGVAGVNIVVDPYDLFGSRKYAGFNEYKAVIASKQRVFETVRLLRGDDEAVILGTSRTDIGISPRHPALPKGKTFNAAMSGQQLWETRELLEALAQRPQGPPKTVIIGLDFFAFNAHMPIPFDYSRDNFSRWRSTELLFSISGLLDSFRTVIRQDRYSIVSRGGLVHEDGFRESIGNPTISLHKAFLGSEEGYLSTTYKPAPGCGWSTSDASRGMDMYRDFRWLMELAHQHHIDLRLFISPSHARQWETLAAAGLWEQFEGWKRTLVAINADVARQHKAQPWPLWDFSGYNHITTKPIDANYYWESSHYRAEVGDKVLDRLFGRAKASDFGALLSEKRLDSWLAETRAKRQQYRASHPQDIAEIAGLAKRAGAKPPCARK